MAKKSNASSVTPKRPKAPTLPNERAEQIARDVFGIEGSVSPLPSYIDQNFRVVTAAGDAWVLKIANPAEEEAIVDFQNRAMDRLDQTDPGVAPKVRKSLNGRKIETIDERGILHLVRMVSYLSGPLLADADHTQSGTWESLGGLLGRIDRSLEGLVHPAMHRLLRWDLAHAEWAIEYSRSLGPAERRRLIQRVHVQFAGHVMRTPSAPAARGDLRRCERSQHRHAGRTRGAVVTGVFDFGDLVHTARIFELAVACAYGVFGQKDPFRVIGDIARGYHGVIPLTDYEFEALFPSVCMRLAVSVAVSALDSLLEPDNEYIRVSEDHAWRALERLAEVDPGTAERLIREACGVGGEITAGLPRRTVVALRSRHVGPSLSLSYERPLEIVRGRMQYLFDKRDRAYLDCVNNVCHVGHCHPKVVEAATRQIETLNTNTRYLHDNIALYAERLAGLLPDPLNVCFFVNSGSEANELALRLARTYTGRYDLIALKGGYHGHTSSLIDLSSYKHDGPGGAGPPEWLHSVPCPDTYRGPYREDDPEAASKYAAEVAEAIANARARGREVSGFIAEPIAGCAGQIVPPDGYFSAAYEHVRAAGGVCIADEVQIGFGRIGTHMWAFEAPGVIPDIVTLGKPIGNGHPLGAVVTTPEIARAFDNGMEFFSTFGGNPVACAVGLAVLDVIESEGLREHALQVGKYLKSGLNELAEDHEAIGDVRGLGLFLGVELVKGRETREPAPDLANAIIESARQTGVLLSTDGPDHNVIKIKPPMPFNKNDAELLISALDRHVMET